MLRELLGRLIRKRDNAVGGPAEEVAEPGKKRSTKTNLLLLLVGGPALAVIAFAGTVTFLTSVKDTKQPPFNMKLVSNLPNRPPGDSRGSLPDTAQQAGQAAAQSLGSPSRGDISKDIPVPPAPATSPVSKQTAPLYVARRDGDTKVVGEFDPFKSEFQKKYEQAEKKEKRSHRGSGDADLSELEKGLRAGPVRQIMPVTQVLPPSPPPRELKLNVSGVVVSRDDSYALTDRGIIRVGSSIDSFHVEKIEFDKVTLRSKDNSNDVRYLFLIAKSVQPGSNTQAAAPISPR
jgi:hypothetical protein